MHPNVHSSTLHNRQDMETTWMSIDRWVDKDVVHVYSGILLSHKKWDAICSNMDATRDYHTKQKVSQKEKDKYDITYMWNLKYDQMSLCTNRNILRDMENRLVVTKEERVWGKDGKEIKLVNPKGNQPWMFTGRTDAEAKAPILWLPDMNSWKRPWCWERLKAGGERDRTIEDAMVGWHHRLDEHEFEQAQGVGDRQGSLACCSPWGHKELVTTEWLN